MSYAVKEIFLTQQGEGFNIGRTAVFIRFAGCNLWSGREKDRADAICKFCDTDFVGGKRLTAVKIAEQAVALWMGSTKPFCVLTGGEPLLQYDHQLACALKVHGFDIAVETNGTQKLRASVDWLCISPKAAAPLVLDRADELKLVFPQEGLEPDSLAGFSAAHRWLSPMDMEGQTAANTGAATAYCATHPQWRLAIQAHKHWGIR